MPNGILDIGTWPTPEKPVWQETLELMELLDEKFMKEYRMIISDYKKKLCKALEASIRSDIGCLCKYNRPEVDLCTEPKIKECLTRLVKTALLYQRLCCQG